MKVRIELEYIIFIVLLSLHNFDYLVRSDTEPKRCRKAGCNNRIANACYLLSHSCESCVCTCILLCSTTTQVTTINTGNSENVAGANDLPELMKEESTLSSDGDHLIEGIS